MPSSNCSSQRSSQMLQTLGSFERHPDRWSWSRYVKFLSSYLTPSHLLPCLSRLNTPTYHLNNCLQAGDLKLIHEANLRAQCLPPRHHRSHPKEIRLAVRVWFRLNPINSIPQSLSQTNPHLKLQQLEICHLTSCVLFRRCFYFSLCCLPLSHPKDKKQTKRTLSTSSVSSSSFILHTPFLSIIIINIS